MLSAAAAAAVTFSTLTVCGKVSLLTHGWTASHTQFSLLKSKHWNSSYSTTGRLFSLNQIRRCNSHGTFTPAFWWKCGLCVTQTLWPSMVLQSSALPSLGRSRVGFFRFSTSECVQGLQLPARFPLDVWVCASLYDLSGGRWRECIIIKELGWKSSYKWVRLKHTQRPVVVQIRSAESPGWRQNQHFYVMLKSLVELNSVNLKYTSANLRNKEPPGACFLRMTSVQFVLLSCAGG